ncbi:hypothetical protein A2U01_0078154, partial [Trifolium medium]|nr:hypothetical protein [Trifolium medium]
HKGNQCVDSLAKLGASSDVDLVIKNSPPICMLDLLKNNTIRIVFIRE